MTITDYTLGHVLGRGSFAIVYDSIHKPTGQKFATKVVDKYAAGSKGLKCIEAEVQCLSKLKHPHIVQLFQHFEGDGKKYMVIELLHGGELFDKIVELQFYTESIANVVVRNLLDALATMHEIGVCHRDVKAENVMLKQPAVEVCSFSRCPCGRSPLILSCHLIRLRPMCETQCKAMNTSKGPVSKTYILPIVPCD